MSAINDLANGESTTRSYVLCVAAGFSYDDFTSGTGLPFCTLPIGAYVLGGLLNITTAWNSGTSDGLEIGDSADDNRYLASTDAQAVAITELSLVNAFDAAGGGNLFEAAAASDEVLIEVTSVGTAASAGVGKAVLLYIDPTKADENYE
jgi:hypothetical protein